MSEGGGGEATERDEGGKDRKMRAELLKHNIPQPSHHRSVWCFMARGSVFINIPV